MVVTVRVRLSLDWRDPAGETLKHRYTRLKDCQRAAPVHAEEAPAMAAKSEPTHPPKRGRTFSRCYPVYLGLIILSRTGGSATARYPAFHFAALELLACGGLLQY